MKEDKTKPSSEETKPEPVEEVDPDIGPNPSWLFYQDMENGYAGEKQKAPKNSTYPRPQG
jgi:hypothetical protein